MTHLIMKTFLSSCITRLVSPGFIPENIAIIGSYLAITLIFLFDLITGPEISFQLLYIFPITFIALHSSQNNLVIGAVALAIALQMGVLFSLHSQTLETQVYLFLLIAFSNIICTLITRYSRANTLEAKHLSTTDPLTQLYNRRVFQHALDAEVVRQRRYGDHFSLALIDLDGFKGLNDSMGHKAGDAALVLLSSILHTQTRQTDTIARLGGDEFVILMPNTKAMDSDTLCHSLCLTISTKMTEKISYPITASIGVVTIEHWTEVSGDILAIADRALYRAKSSGKGCVVREYAVPREIADILEKEMQ
jgi:diguanylate cyclase (GGDEF)-like protein